MEKKRLLWADVSKGYLIILVVLGHVIQSFENATYEDNLLWKIIYSFHMPAFFAISGFFAYKNKSHQNESSNNVPFGNLIYRRFLQLLVPYFIWSLVKFVNSGVFTFERLSYIVLQPDYYFWFLWVLFFIFFFFLCARKIATFLKCDDSYLIILGGAILVSVMVKADARLFGFQFISYYYLYFIFGYFMNKYNISTTLTTNRQGLLPIICFCFWLFLAYFWNMHTLPSWLSDLPLNSLILFAYKGVTAVLAILFIFYLAPKLFNSDSKWHHWMSLLGQLSLGIYIIHILLLKVTKQGLIYICSSISTSVIEAICWLLLVVVSMIVVALLSKSKILSRFLLGKI